MISLVMPAFNAEAFISRALKSVEAQTHAVDEVIVVDDGSSDGTAAVVEQWKKSLPIILVRNARNLGVGASLRRGVEISNGDFILRLDADDCWLPDHVSALQELAKNIPDAGLFCANSRYLNEYGTELGISCSLSDDTVRGMLMWDNPIVHSAVGFRRELYDACGGYSSEVIWQDYYLWIRMLKVGTLAVSEPVSVIYTVRLSSVSRERKAVALAARWHCQRQAIAAFWRKHPFRAAMCAWFGWSRTQFSRLM